MTWIVVVEFEDKDDTDMVELFGPFVKATSASRFAEAIGPSLQDDDRDRSVRIRIREIDKPRLRWIRGQIYDFLNDLSDES